MIRAFALGLITALLLAAPPAAASEFDQDFVAGMELHGKVDYVFDGDTIRIGPARIRLFGIDAPELATPAGPMAREVMKQLVEGMPVSCMLTGDRSYDRYVAVCFLGDSVVDIGWFMVREGLAVDDRFFSGGVYLGAERDARIHGRGIWANGLKSPHSRSVTNAEPGRGISYPLRR